MRQPTISAERHLHAAKLVGPGRGDPLGEEPEHEVQLHREAGRRLEVVAAEEAGSAVERVGSLDIAVDQHILPGDERLVEDQDRVVLVEPARQRIIERAARGGLVRRPAEEFAPRRVERRDEDEREIFRAPRLQIGRTVLRHERPMRDRRPGRQHLRAADDDPIVALADEVDEDIGDLVDRLLPIDRRVDEDVIEKQPARGEALVQGERVVVVWRVEGRIGREARHERRLVVGRAPHEAVAQPRPGRDRLARRQEFLRRVARLIEAVGADTARIDGGQQIALCRVVERIVEPGDRARRIAERRVRRHVLDPLAIEIDRPPVAQARQIVRRGQEIVRLCGYRRALIYHPASALHRPLARDASSSTLALCLARWEMPGSRVTPDAAAPRRRRRATPRM